MAKEIVVHRGGLLQPPELMEEGTTAGQNISQELILAFCQELLKNTWSWDRIYLAAYAAKSLTGSSSGEMQSLIQAIKTFKRTAQ